MLSTKKLEEYIKIEITNRLGNVDFRDIYFKVVNEHNNDGVYVFSKKEKYHIVYIERGKVKEEKIIYQKEDVLWFVLEDIAFELTVQYALQNRSNDKDFRRALFKREIEIYSLFGEMFKQKKEKEIEEILKENPYNDAGWFLKDE